MGGLVGAAVTAENLDPVCSTETGCRINAFRPSEFVYRTAVAGAMLRVVLNSLGENFYSLFNHWAAAGRGALERGYRRLLSLLPRAAVTDGALLRESGVGAENYNVILDGTATALGSLKRAEVRSPGGRLWGYVVVGARHDSLRAVPNLLTHHFRLPGARWRFFLFSADGGELDAALTIHEVALREFGLGARHSIRGRFRILDVEILEPKPVRGEVSGRLVQPLICRGGSVSRALGENGLRPTGAVNFGTRLAGIPPWAEAVPAVWGVFSASAGYSFELDGETFLVTGEDLRWPVSVS